MNKPFQELLERTNQMLNTIYQSVLEGRAPETAQSVQQALDAGHNPGEILNQGMIDAMAEVGRRFEAGDMFVPEMLIAARAMKQGLTVLQPHLVDAGVEPLDRVVLGTVKGDLHDIGKNLVGMMLEGSGFEVIDLGVDVSPEGFVEAVKAHQPGFVGLSSLLTTTMPAITQTIDALKAGGVRDHIKVMVGGAPVTQAFADEIGADLYAPDAASATTRAKASL
jgi:5-methyltetrahydrofolate--homocysteine methyltransferase